MNPCRPNPTPNRIPSRSHSHRSTLFPGCLYQDLPFFLTLPSSGHCLFSVRRIGHQYHVFDPALWSHWGYRYFPIRFLIHFSWRPRKRFHWSIVQPRMVRRRRTSLRLRSLCTRMSVASSYKSSLDETTVLGKTRWRSKKSKIWTSCNHLRVTELLINKYRGYSRCGGPESTFTEQTCCLEMDKPSFLRCRQCGPGRSPQSSRDEHQEGTEDDGNRVIVLSVSDAMLRLSAGWVCGSE